MRPTLEFDSSLGRILECLRLFVGRETEAEELEILSGISEYARRVREWSVEFGWLRAHGAVVTSANLGARARSTYETTNLLRL